MGLVWRQPVVDRDTLLMALGQTLNDQLRWVDLSARTDADEFTLALPETVAEDAIALTRKLDSALSQLAAGEDGAPIAACYGIAEWRKGDDAAALLARACAAMAEARGERDSYRYHA